MAPVRLNVFMERKNKAMIEFKTKICQNIEDVLEIVDKDNILNGSHIILRNTIIQQANFPEAVSYGWSGGKLVRLIALYRLDPGKRLCYTYVLKEEDLEKHNIKKSELILRADENDMLIDWRTYTLNSYLIARTNPFLRLNTESLKHGMPVLELNKGFEIPVNVNSESKDIYIITNRYSVNGSSVLCQSQVLDRLKNQIGDFYIMPYSNHFVMCISEKKVREAFDNDVDLGEKELVDIMMSFNLKNNENDILTNNLYRYTKQGQVVWVNQKGGL